MATDRIPLGEDLTTTEDDRSQNTRRTHDAESAIDEELERERIREEQENSDSTVPEVEEPFEYFESEIDLETEAELDYDPEEADMKKILEKGRYEAQTSESIISDTNFMQLNSEVPREIEVYSGHAGTMQIWKEKDSLVVAYEIDDNLNFDCPEVKADQIETEDLELLTRLKLGGGTSGIVIETPQSELRETIYELSEIDETLRTEGQFSGESILYMANHEVDGELEMAPTTDEFDRNRSFYELKDRIEGEETYSGR